MGGEPKAFEKASCPSLELAEYRRRWPEGTGDLLELRLGLLGLILINSGKFKSEQGEEDLLFSSLHTHYQLLLSSLFRQHK